MTERQPPRAKPERTLRPGPRPLPLHLAMAGAAWTGSLSGLSASSAAWMHWNASASARANPLADDLAAVLAAAEPAALAEAVRGAAARRLSAFLDGLDAYRSHDFKRAAPAAKIVWTGGGARLLDYGSGDEAHVVLLIPSLVNRCYILDLLPRRSLAAFLAAAGIRPLLFDWGDIVGEEFGFDLGDFVVKRVEPAFAEAQRLAAGRPLTLAGYCMGGNIALALAQRRIGDIAGLALLATPWDFHAERPESARALAAFAGILMPGFRTLGAMPLDVLQGLFAGLDPLLAYRKFRRFAALDPDVEDALVFVALEDWLNDGVPLPWRVAEECLIGWYGENTPGRGAWTIAGVPVRPEAFTKPALAVIPNNDRIVPPASALPLARALPSCTTLRASAGHIGMMAGSRAETELWAPLAEWIRARV
jgi:polyhydroxyalkanoate synthase